MSDSSDARQKLNPHIMICKSNLMQPAQDRHLATFIGLEYS